MIVFGLLATSFIFQITSNRAVFGAEINKNLASQEEYDGLKFTKRYISALAKSGKIPVQPRSFGVPPMISVYGGTQRDYADDYANRYKRYLAALAKNGQLTVAKPQQKKMANFENEEPDEFAYSNKEDIPSPIAMKLEMIRSLKSFILQNLHELNKKYDPRKVDLFLENLVNTVYDQNEEITLENIKTLVKSDYFYPEETVDTKKLEFPKRNIQSLVRDFNVSFSGITQSEPQARQVRVPKFFNPLQYDTKRNLESVIKNKFAKRYFGSMAKNYNFPSRTGKRDSDEELLEYGEENLSPFEYNDGEPYLKNLMKRHTMYDINEPDISYEYPSQGNEQNDYNDYAEQMGQDAAIPIGKRYLGTLARSGWLPPGFTLRSSTSPLPKYQKKRHIGALARLGWLPSVQESRMYYYRGGRGRDFRPPSLQGPKAYFLKSESKSGRCQCKRNANPSGSESSWPSLPEQDTSTDASREDLLVRQTSNMLEKRFLLIPAVDYFVLRNLYPHLLRDPNLTRN